MSWALATDFQYYSKQKKVHNQGLCSVSQWDIYETFTSEAHQASVAGSIWQPPIFLWIIYRTPLDSECCMGTKKAHYKSCLILSKQNLISKEKCIVSFLSRMLKIWWDWELSSCIPQNRYPFQLKSLLDHSTEISLPINGLMFSFVTGGIQQNGS